MKELKINEEYIKIVSGIIKCAVEREEISPAIESIKNFTKVLQSITSNKINKEHIKWTTDILVNSLEMYVLLKKEK